jgi:hypothetical protein
MDNEETKELLKWLQSMPLSWRTGKIARDFSDGGKIIKTLRSLLSPEKEFIINLVKMTLPSLFIHAKHTSV